MRHFICFVFVSIISVSATRSQDVDGATAERMREHVKILASDEFEGRAPSTPGETKTINYIQNELSRMGVEPGNGSSYLQPVELVNIKVKSSDVLVNNLPGMDIFEPGVDIAVTTKLTDKQVQLLNSDIVFVGYGAVAPEYDWNDYQDLDVKGKTVLILDQDPGHLSGDDKIFKGTGVTYYARSSYKYEEAKRQGAAAAFIIHDQDFSTASWQRMSAFTERAALSLDPQKVQARNLNVEGRIPAASVEKLFENAKLSYEEEKQKALKHGFRGYPLKSQISLSLQVDVEKSVSNNVIGIIPGTERPDEYVFYLAHWDHLGTNNDLAVDQIYNGARDNASGIAGILEIARTHMDAGAPKRSIVILAVTAEESGLLGSHYYALNPVYPLSSTVTALNIDTMNIFGRTRDVWVLGLGDSEMDEFVYSGARDKGGKVVTYFPHPEWGIEYRGDHFSFNRMGVPSIVVAGGYDTIDPDNDMDAKIDEYDRDKYHKVTDEYEETMDFLGAADDVHTMFLIGNDIANSAKFPNWRDGSEFKYLRDQHIVIRKSLEN